ncbi:MAG: DUF2269 family protein [Oleiphilaceae bacterium]|nr:DUF2269 family protein [Oleiphilaceae bacterium]
MAFTLWKFVHLIGVIIFLGNISTGFFWKAHAEKYRDQRILMSAFEGIYLSDRWITNTCVVIIILSGIMMAYVTDLALLTQGWVIASFVVFLLAGAFYSKGIIPLNRKIIAHLAQEKPFGDQEWQEYERMRKPWFLMGLAATATPFLVLAIMFFKPQI